MVLRTRRKSPFYKKLIGSHVLITGGSSGIGLALAKLFLSSGADVTIAARNTDRLEFARNELKSEASFRTIHTLQLDVSDSFSVLKSKLEDHINEYGAVDILVHCAGFAVSRTFLETSPADVEALTRTNYIGAVHVTRILLPYMLTHSSPTDGSGERDKTTYRRIAFVSSMAGQVALYGYTGYCGSKFALRGFAEALSMELEGKGIYVTVSFPPDTDTPGFMAENVGKPEATREISSAGGRPVDPDQVARQLYQDLLAGRLVSTFGVEGSVLAWATAGLLPPVAAWRRGGVHWLAGLAACMAEASAAGLLRAFGMAYALWMRSVVSRHERKTSDGDG